MTLKSTFRQFLHEDGITAGARQVVTDVLELFKLTARNPSRAGAEVKSRAAVIGAKSTRDTIVRVNNVIDNVIDNPNRLVPPSVATGGITSRPQAEAVVLMLHQVNQSLAQIADEIKAYAIEMRYADAGTLEQSERIVQAGSFLQPSDPAIMFIRESAHRTFLKQILKYQDITGAVKVSPAVDLVERRLTATKDDKREDAVVGLYRFLLFAHRQIEHVWGEAANNLPEEA